MAADQMMIRIILCEKFLDTVPVIQSFGGTEIILIRHTPPHLREGREAPEEIIKIRQVVFQRHRGKSPMVVRMKQNEVNLDANLKELMQTLLESIPERKTRVIRIPASVRTLSECVILRVVVIIEIVLRENAHADLVERRMAQRLDGLVHEFIGLVRKRIDRCSESIIRRSILVIEVNSLRADDAVVPCCRGKSRKRPSVRDFPAEALHRIVILTR